MKLSRFLYPLVFLIIFFLSVFYPKLLYAQTVLFDDDFEMDRSGQWNIIRGNWIRHHISESYRFGLSLNSPSSTTEAQGGDYTWTNYEFSFDILPINGTDRNIYFRVRPERSGSFWGMDVPVSYGLHMYSNRIWLQKWTVNSQIEPVTLPISLPDNTITHFKIQVLDNNIKVFINNNTLPIIDYSDSINPILSGRIALGITTGNAYPTEVWFDNIRVVQILNSQPKLIITKHVENNNGGVSTAGDFNVNVTGNNVSDNSFVGSETGTEILLDPGSYSIDEDENTGYLKTLGTDCSGTIAAGETKTCLITNDDIAPTITLIKNITGGGSAGIDDFGMSLNGNTVSSGSVTEVLANDPVIINESGLDNYEFVSITGDGCPNDLGESVTLLPGENLSCTITNNYIAPTPVTKVFVVPGLGASWNVDALINCKESGYSGEWTLAPYAKDVYNPLLSTLANQGWTAIALYYDWRQDVRDNSLILNDLINSNVSGDEKVNIVGHSMGGLVGRSYLESQSGGKASKFLSVGTPNHGSTFAYPIVAGNEIWTNDLVIKIAATLFSKHCGIPVSIKNLLPTYDYLRDAKTGQVKPVTEMATKNNYLPTDFISPFWDVKVGTLSGRGVSTLKIIDVIKNPKWPDGRPTKKEYVSEGDGTVLVDSAQITGADVNQVINQSHSGVIASDEGVDKILKFFGSPGIDDPEYKEHKSALILIGYPGIFSITDKNGNKKDSEDGIIAIMDPKDEKYQLQINPTSGNTTFIVGQFLTNGQTEYQEYKFKGNSISPKVLEFNSKNARKDVLHEVWDYQKPHFPNPNFPKFWFGFWKFWSKFKK